jgi:hypothetical protein
MSANTPKLHLVKGTGGENSEADTNGRGHYVTVKDELETELSRDNQPCEVKMSEPDCHMMLKQICEILNREEPEVVGSNKADTIVIWKQYEGSKHLGNYFKSVREALREALKEVYSKL